jgi:hypothetical protein
VHRLVLSALFFVLSTSPFNVDHSIKRAVYKALSTKYKADESYF